MIRIFSKNLNKNIQNETNENFATILRYYFFLRSIFKKKYKNVIDSEYNSR